MSAETSAEQTETEMWKDEPMSMLLKIQDQLTSCPRPKGVKGMLESFGLYMDPLSFTKRFTVCLTGAVVLFLLIPARDVLDPHNTCKLCIKHFGESVRKHRIPWLQKGLWG